MKGINKRETKIEMLRRILNYYTTRRRIARLAGSVHFTRDALLAS
jgi:hypothetical protein